MNQVQGGILEGVSAALYGEITVKSGVVRQSNFNDYRFCRMQDTPEINVHFIDSEDDPRGLGGRTITSGCAGDHKCDLSPPQAGGFDHCRSELLRASGSFNFTRNVNLLCQRQSRVGRPVKHEPGREKGKQY